MPELDKLAVPRGRVAKILQKGRKDSPQCSRRLCLVQPQLLAQAPRRRDFILFVWPQML
jgi:hypothetical protein